MIGYGGGIPASIPRVPDPTRAQQPPEKLGYDINRHALAAQLEAKRRFPGPAGEILAAEIAAYVSFGFRISPASPVPRLIAELVGETP